MILLLVLLAGVAYLAGLAFDSKLAYGAGAGLLLVASVIQLISLGAVPSA